MYIMEGTQCITPDYTIYSFKSTALLSWPYILQDDNVFEFHIRFTNITYMHDMPVKVLKNNQKWYKYIQGSTEIKYHKNLINQPESLNECYDLLVDYEFKCYKQNIIMIYMKINLLRDNDHILPDIANHMKKLIC